MTPSKILNRFGSPMKKNAWGLYSSIYEFPNQGRFHNRTYQNQDAETGAGFFNRDLLVRWSREMSRQQPFIYAGIRSKALFAVGKEYNPIYIGHNQKWGDMAMDYLKEVFYPNACLRGRNYDFKTMMFLESVMLDIDGDMLEVFGEKNGVAAVQIIPCHRIYSTISNDGMSVVSPSGVQNNNISTIDGPVPDSMMSDGVIYDKKTGEAIGYNVVNSTNVVTSMYDDYDSRPISIANSHLQYDPDFFDRGRGMPSISSGILQALSLQEIEQSMVEKIKIESMVALIEKSPEGMGPYEEGQVYQQYLNQEASVPPVSGLNGLGINQPSSAQGLRIQNGPGIRYLSVEGDIKTLSSTTPGEQTSDYITKLEAQVLHCIGVPHSLLFSHNEVSGRMSDGVVKIFNASIEHRQELLDKSGKFMIAYALAKAIKNGDLPPNDDENLGTVFNLSHPAPLSLNSSYDRNDKIKAYQAGTATLKDTIDIPLDQFISQIEKEKILFFESAQRISKLTGVELPIVIQSMRDDLAQKTAPPQAKTITSLK